MPRILHAPSSESTRTDIRLEKEEQNGKRKIGSPDLSAENPKFKERVHQMEAEREILRGVAPKKASGIFSGAAPDAQAEGDVRPDPPNSQRVRGIFPLLGVRASRTAY